MSLLLPSLVIAVSLGVCAFIALLLADDSEYQEQQLQLEEDGSNEHSNLRQPTDASVLEQKEGYNKENHHQRAAHNYSAMFFLVCHELWEHCPSAQTTTNLLLVAVTALLAFIAWKQYLFSEASDRAYVTLGAKNGKLAEFGNLLPDGKRIVIIHFTNSGRGVARHFAAHLITGRETNSWQRRRYRGPLGVVTASFSMDNVDLGPDAEYRIYVTDPALLKMDKELAAPDLFYNINGEFEYCDAFGGYHCDSFGVKYQPPPVKEFVGGIKLPCIVEPDINARFETSRGYVEIDPCEQPNEPEYMKARPVTHP